MFMNSEKDILVSVANDAILFDSPQLDKILMFHYPCFTVWRIFLSASVACSQLQNVLSSKQNIN